MKKRVFVVATLLAASLLAARAEAFSMVNQTEEEVAANTFIDEFPANGRPDGALVLLDFFASQDEIGIRRHYTFRVVEYLSDPDCDLHDSYPEGNLVGLRGTPLNPYANAIGQPGLYVAFLRIRRAGGLPVIMSMKAAPVELRKDPSGVTQRIVHNAWKPVPTRQKTPTGEVRMTAGPLTPEPLDTFAARIRNR